MATAAALLCLLLPSAAAWVGCFVPRPSVIPLQSSVALSTSAYAGSSALSRRSSFTGERCRCSAAAGVRYRRRHDRTRMFFGPGESFFGVGAPEAAVVVAIGYFVLGPTELYKLIKVIGQVVGQFKDFGVNTATNLQVG